MNDFWAKALLFLLFSTPFFLIAANIAWYFCQQDLKEAKAFAVERGAAYYNSQTGEFKWKEKKDG